MASSDAVRKQLSKILNSEGFIHAGRMKRFLAFVVEEALAGRASQLCEYSIGISVFERSESFEPGVDAIVRNDARRLRQKLLEYYQQAGKGDAISITVPKGGYVPAIGPAVCGAEAEHKQVYRLSVTLTRVADGAEIWAAEQELQVSEDAEENRFALQFQVTSRPTLAAHPNSRSSDRAHRLHRSLGQAAK